MPSVSESKEKPQPAPPCAVEPIWLNVGGGKGPLSPPGWRVVDLRERADYRLDVTREPLPFDDASVDLIFTSHMLEHIYPKDLPFVLGEFRRVLKTADRGGRLRVVVPDIERACRAYLERDEAFFREAEVAYAYPDAPLGGLLASWMYSISDVGNGHVHCFDFEYLAWWLRNAGFAGIERSAPGQSAAPAMRAPGLDLHPHASLYVEAWRQEARRLSRADACSDACPDA